MKFRVGDFADLSFAARLALVRFLNAPGDAVAGHRAGLRARLEVAVGEQRLRQKRRLVELETTAHVVKKGNWGLMDVVPALAFAQNPKHCKPRWTRGAGLRWPLKDAERYAKLFGGTVTRFP
jgi:hypothetical protein